MGQSTLLVVIVSLQNLGFNLVHPVTPMFIAAVGLQDWIFGVSYASMALTSFLFSKEAGELCRRFESRYIFAIGCFGYAATQLMFLFSVSEGQVIFWRLLSGVFVAMINVASLVYLVRSSDEGHRARNLTYLATATAVTTALGYMVGGIIGDGGYELAFFAQVAFLAMAGSLLAVAGRDYGIEGMGVKALLRNGNPFHLGPSGYCASKRTTVYLAIALVSISALTIYEQSLNYYLKDVLGFMPADIGYLKGAIGVVTLVSNQLIALRLIRGGRMLRHIGIVFSLASILSLSFAVFSTGVAFVVCNLAFTVFNAVHLPLVQELVTSSDQAHQEVLVSLYSEMRSVGWVVGGLVAGFAYEVAPLLPFVVAALLFGMMAATCLCGNRAYSEE